jgi:putative membrane protein
VLLQKSCSAGLDEDHVDGMAGGVVQIAGDARPLLGGRQAPLAFGIALGSLRALLDLLEPFSSQARPVAGEPGGDPDDGAERQLGGEPIADQVGPEQDEEAGYKYRRPGAWTRLVAVLGGGVEGDCETDWWTEAVLETVERRCPRGHESKNGKWCNPPPGKRQRGHGGEYAAPHVEITIGPVDAAVGEQGERKREDGAGDDCVEEELVWPSEAHGAENVARRLACRVAPWEDPRPSRGGRTSPPWERCGGAGRARTVVVVNTFHHIAPFVAGSHWDHHGFWWFPVALLWVVVLGATIWFVVRRVGPRDRGGIDWARGILAERYARGEVSGEEYRERLDELSRPQ